MTTKKRTCAQGQFCWVPGWSPCRKRNQRPNQNKEGQRHRGLCRLNTAFDNEQTGSRRREHFILTKFSSLSACLSSGTNLPKMKVNRLFGHLVTSGNAVIYARIQLRCSDVGSAAAPRKTAGLRQEFTTNKLAIVGR